MDDLHEEKDEFQRHLRKELAEYLSRTIAFPKDNRLWKFAQKEKARLTRQLRTGAAICALPIKRKAKGNK